MNQTENRLVTAAARAAAAGARVAAENTAAQQELAEALRELELVLRSPSAPAPLRAAYVEAVERLRDAERRHRLVHAAAGQVAADRGRQGARGPVR